MTFEEYLSSKSIDSGKFRAAEPLRWEEWRTQFDLMHPNSFTARYLYLINPTRRKYHCPLQPAAGKQPAPERAALIMKPKIS